MGLSIHTNYTSLVTQNTLNSTNKMLGTAMERLGTGFRINSAADDAAGLQIATRLQAQTNGQGVAMRNAQDAISMMQTAEGAFDEMSNIVHRMKDLATQAANGTNGQSEMEAMNAEYVELAKELDNVMKNTSYGSGTKLLDVDVTTPANSAGKFAAGAMTFQIGSSSAETMEVDVSTSIASIMTNAGGSGILDLKGLVSDGTETGLSGDSATNTTVTAGSYVAADYKAAASQTLASGEMDKLNGLLDTIGATRGQLGANINRLEHTITNLGNMRENGEAAKGRIMDADFASEASNMSKNQMLMQSGMSVLSNANQMSGLVMSLLR